MKCERCNGRKYIELDKIGLRVMTCPDCNGTGVVADIVEGFVTAEVSDVPVGKDGGFVGYGSTDTKDVPAMYITPYGEELASQFRQYLEPGVVNDNDGTNGTDKPAGGGDTSKSKLSPKRKKAKRTRKKVS